MDCNGDCFGIAFLDECDVCSGGASGHESNSDMDCNGDCFGSAYFDNCGICSGGATGNIANSNIDDCGICFGFNQDKDCNGDCFGEASLDQCGICSGGESGHAAGSDMDCNGDCFGSAYFDNCGICSGGATGNIANSNIDDCGVCFGLNQDKDCNGDCFGVAFLDECDVCSSGDSGHVAGSDIDLCGICFGQNSCIPKVVSSSPSNTIQFNQPNIYIEFSVPIDDNSLNNIVVTSGQSNNLDYDLNLDGNDLDIIFNQITSLDTIDILIPSSDIFSSDGIPMNLDGSHDISLQYGVQMLGDYNNDQEINFNDLLTFLNVWQLEELDYELGPFTGSAPNLTVNFDRQFDIQDIVAFIYMWDWFNQENLVNVMNVSDANNMVEFNIENDILSLQLPELEDVMALRIQVINPNVSMDEMNLSNHFDIVLNTSNQDKGIKEVNLGRIQTNDMITNLNLFHLATNVKQKIEIRYEIIDEFGDVLFDGIKYLDYKPQLDDYHLYAAYPNPFNPSTTIDFAIPNDTNVSISVYDIKGRKVAELASGFYNTGYYSVQWNAELNSSGTYFVKMTADDFVKTEKLVLIK